MVNDKGIWESILAEATGDEVFCSLKTQWVLFHFGFSLFQLSPAWEILNSTVNVRRFCLVVDCFLQLCWWNQYGWTVILNLLLLSPLVVHPLILGVQSHQILFVHLFQDCHLQSDINCAIWTVFNNFSNTEVQLIANFHYFSVYFFRFRLKTSRIRNHTNSSRQKLNTLP